MSRVALDGSSRGVGLNAADERTSNWRAGLCLSPTSTFLKSKLFAAIIITITLTITTIATITTKMQPEKQNLDTLMVLYGQWINQDHSPGLTHIVIQSLPGQQGEPIEGNSLEGWASVLPASASHDSLASATSAASTSSGSNMSSDEEGEQSQN
ncbi:unnamed protein product [Clonostachys chloroleuca]|uniref:Uncharacterized protein n=1 Tax=Clonostachys chloroleuca TaxID=1926264 RepID=A0AA35QG65_9HYPO|nr:unnamed protein product [Clonostachys chloroleuca]